MNKKTIPYARQDISKNDIKNVIKSLRANFVTQGPLVPKFESAVAKVTGAKYGVAVNSGSSALHLACIALGLKKNDILWTSANTFVSSANCALHCGAKIDLIDIDPSTNNISIADLKNKLKKAKKNHQLPKIVMPVDFAGLSCHMQEIKKLSKIYNFKILEDASHALGAKYKNSSVGDCKFSDITVFSFHAVKIITTGEGGIAMTNNKQLAEKIKMLRTHGITRDKRYMKNKKKLFWYYEQKYLGFNYRMTEIQAALGISQLKRLKNFVKKRNIIAKFYILKLSNLPIELPKEIKNIKSSYHLFVIKLKSNLIKISRDQLCSKLRSLGINTNLHYIPLYLHPYFKKFNFKKKSFPNMENYYKNAISIPMYYSLSKKNQKTIIKHLKYFLGQT